MLPACINCMGNGGHISNRLPSNLNTKLFNRVVLLVINKYLMLTAGL